jgi:catalase
VFLEVEDFLKTLYLEKYLKMTEELFELGKEYPPPEEEAQIDRLVAGSKLAMERKPHPPMLRDQHPKSHGCVKGQLIVEANIPEVMKVGVFKDPKTYDLWIRFSNGSSSNSQGQLQSDTIGDVRGMAIKLLNVEGKKVIEDPAHAGEQDFILINSPTFFIRDVQGYMDFFPVVQAIKEGKIILKPGEPPQVPESFQAQFKAVAEANVFKLVEKIKAKSTNSLLEITYWSATPYKLGDRAMKFSVVPNFTGESFNPVTAANKDNYLREAMTKQLATQGTTFDFKVQLQTDAAKMPVEDPTVEWNEQESPFVKVATIQIPQQNFNTGERKQFDEQQSFSPWHTLPEQQPLGGVNRARKRIYQELSQFRNEMNQSKNV